VLVTNLGYPRIGRQRELKRLLESYWEGRCSTAELIDGAQAIEEANWRRQLECGIELLPVGDFSLYDHVLDTAVMFSLIPARFKPLEDHGGLDLYFALARGTEDAPALAMRKWFDTNYHYLVPEWNPETQPVLSRNLPLDAFRRAQRRLGTAGKPVVLGPFTFVKLSRVTNWQEALEAMVPPYTQMLQEMEAAGVEWVEVDEPALVCDVTAAELKALTATYTELARSLKNLKIMLQTYFGSANWFSHLITLPVAGIGLDFVRGRRGNLANLEHYGFPPGKVLGAGIVDGRNVWRTNIEEALRLLEKLQSFVPRERLWLQPSCSLLHLPLSTAGENSLPPALREALAFADERLAELRLLKRALAEGTGVVAPEISAANRALRALETMDHRRIPAVRARVAALKEEDFSRPTPFSERKELQKRRLGLPPLPTTTIGSFPQTPDLRAARARFRRGEISRQEYQALVREKIAAWIRLQERLGLDLLVHGEFERSDMVEYFAARLPGFALTTNGWVQSYGSRCVKPPILYGDVWRSQPLTVAETTHAQSLTSKPVKAILTGPVTLLKWSFVREDLSEQEIAYQLALVIRDEIRDLEREGITAIQIDEPAFREGLPLRARDRERYLYWAVTAFRLATAGAGPETQIHTHMCYSEFGDIIHAIEGLDADVISLEAARSGAGVLAAFRKAGYRRDIGLGVFDVHSPHPPEEEAMARLLREALRVFAAEQLWVNPDCGLKTRREEEAVAALERMVAVARRLRATLAPERHGK